MKVYSAINAVQSELSKIGISKDRKNEQQNYKFRGIDDIYQAIAPLLAKNGLCILPRVLTREFVERVNARGTPLFYVTVAVEFDFVCAEDGSKHVVTTYGEAMDSADKATNKAMSAAYKYAALQAFCIPTEGDNDADATTHEVRPRDYKAEADALVAEIEAHDSPTSLAMWEQVNRPRVTGLFKPAPAEFARVKAAKERLLASFQTEQEAA